MCEAEKLLIKPKVKEKNKFVLYQVIQKIIPVLRIRNNGQIMVERVDNLIRYIASCCQTISEDNISDFIIQGGGILSIALIAIN